MSLRAIQKRDRNKLSAQAQATKQHHAFINSSSTNKSRSFALSAGTTTGSVGTAATTAGHHHHHHHHHHSSGPGGKNDKWRNSNASLSSSTVINYSSSSPTTEQAPLSHKKRSVSYPTLQKKKPDNSHASLRFTKSESDLQSYRNGGSADEGSSPNHSANSQNNLLYLGAKSEVCLKTLAVKSTHQPPAPFRQAVANQHRIAGPGNRMYESNRRPSDLGSNKLGGLIGIDNNNHAVRIPIIGYEVMEERARFTIFKLRIENSISHTCWLVLRRYTDFVRLNNKLRTLYPHCQLVLPRKKWFGDNFSSGFIDNRIQGLQTFINTILGDDAMRSNPAVREFFCLDEPPAYSESMEESRIIFEAQEETISHLKQQLQTKDELVAALQAKLASEINRNKVLTTVIRNSFENCSKCAKQLDNHLKESAYK